MFRMFHNDFIANLPLSLSVKEFWKSVNIWRSYRQKYSGCFFWLTVYICTIEITHIHTYLLLVSCTQRKHGKFCRTASVRKADINSTLWDVQDIEMVTWTKADPQQLTTTRYWYPILVSAEHYNRNLSAYFTK